MSRDSTLSRFDTTEQSLQGIDTRLPEMHSSVDDGNTRIEGSITTIQHDVGVILSIIKPDDPPTPTTSHIVGAAQHEAKCADSVVHHEKHVDF